MKKLKDCTRSERILFFLFKLIYRRPTDYYGLRFDVSVLEHVKPQLVDWPIDWLTIFADAMTVIDVEYGLHSCGIDSIECIHYNHLNTTAIGNVAYIAVYHPDHIVKDRAYHLLNECIIEQKSRIENNKQK